MIGRDYLLKKPAGPSKPKLFFDTKVVPVAVNAAGRLEVALDHASVRTGLRPSVILAGVLTTLLLALLSLLRGRARTTRRS